jgi:Uma2 family endonuclease
MSRQAKLDLRGANMATPTHISLLEYMKTSYRPDREYIDGELLERNVGKWEHARLQFLLASWFRTQEKAWSVQGATEQRLRVSPSRVRIPDVMLVERGPQPEVIVDPPVLVVEILSPDDTYSDTQRRSADYLNMGVRAVWIIDPASRTGRQCVGDTWTAAEILKVPGTPILVELSKLFADLDEG